MAAAAAAPLCTGKETKTIMRKNAIATSSKHYLIQIGDVGVKVAIRNFLLSTFVEKVYVAGVRVKLADVNEIADPPFNI